MRKTLIALLCCLSVLACAQVCAITASADNGAVLPDTLSIEYTGENTVLPVYPSDGSQSFSVTISDADGKVFAENRILYTFDVGDYVLEYSVYNNSDITSPAEKYTVKVKVSDTTAPAISVRGGFAQKYTAGSEVTVPVGEATDIHDGKTDCTVTVTKDGKQVAVVGGKITVETGTYKVEYTSADSFGNVGSREFTFTVYPESGAQKTGKGGCGSKSVILVSVICGSCAVLAAAGCVVFFVIRRKRNEK